MEKFFKLTCNAGKELFGEMLNLTAGKRHKLVSFQEIKDALSEEVCDNTYMVPEVEAITKVYAFVAIILVVVRQRLEYTELDP